MSDDLERVTSTSRSTTLSHCVTDVASSISPRSSSPRQCRPRAKSFTGVSGGGSPKSLKSAPSHLQSVVSLFSCRGSGSRYATELDAAKQESALLQEELDDMRLLNTALLKDLETTTASRALQQAQDGLPSANEIGLKQEVCVHLFCLKTEKKSGIRHQ